MDKATFTVEITSDSAVQFAEVSGDWNPLHTNKEYAAKTSYGRTILHGAFSAGLISRLAGMELPGEKCLLHNMQLRFLAPIFPPATLVVEGVVLSDNGSFGKVQAAIRDAQSGTTYVDASYEFSRHDQTERGADIPQVLDRQIASGDPSAALTLITGATGGLGGALLSVLGARAIGVSRSDTPGTIHITDLENIAAAVGDQKLAAIVHCAWPAPDNSAFSGLAEPSAAIEYNVAAPLRHVHALASLLSSNGIDGAPLVLIGSTASEPGRHNYRAPLYSLAKSMIPTLVRVLATELASHNKRCIGVNFDILDGGMSAMMNRVAKVAHADRSPFGIVPTVAEAAAQIEWVLANPSPLASGATLTLSGGAIP